jgi:hypothetical protein
MSLKPNINLIERARRTLIKRQRASTSLPRALVVLEGEALTPVLDSGARDGDFYSSIQSLEERHNIFKQIRFPRLFAGFLSSYAQLG